MYAYSDETCHLHFWQNDRGLLRATVVTRGVERTPKKSQHTKLTLEKKILPPLLPGFELATFRSRVRRSYQQAIPAPYLPTYSHKDAHTYSLHTYVQHAKLTLEKKILPLLLPGFELTTFRSRVRRSYQQAISASVYAKLTLEMKIIPPLLPGFELATFRSRVRRSYQ